MKTTDFIVVMRYYEYYYVGIMGSIKGKLTSVNS